MLKTPRLRSLVVLALLAFAIAAMAGPAGAATPSNDAFANADELIGAEVFVTGTNDDATAEAGEPEHAGEPAAASVWYRWSPSASGRATLALCGGFDGRVAIYTGDVLALLDEVDFGDADCDAASRVRFDAVVGTTYRIAIDGFDGDTGTFSLSLRHGPVNDDLEDAIELGGESGTVDATTVGASWEGAEPDHSGYGWNSIWYRWTAPSDGWATFTTCGSVYPNFASVLAVYTGDAYSNLTGVADDEGCYPSIGSRVHFVASAGTAYRIAVSGSGGETGRFTLVWNRSAPPPVAIVPPSISGIARDGETLTANEGTWRGEGPFSFAYAWGRCDRDYDACSFIDGATAKTFSIRSMDVGHYLWVRVTAANASGSGIGFSYDTALVAAAPPLNSVAPGVEGEARLNSILVASPGSWTGTAPISYAFQWQACDYTITVCTDVPGQTGQMMRVADLSLGDVLRVVVTATNVAGSATAASAGTDVERQVAAAPRRRCVVPNVRGRMLAAARRAIRRNRCSVGSVRRSFSGRLGRGRVISQTPRAGSRLRVGARVNIVVSKGSRR